MPSAVLAASEAHDRATVYRDSVAGMHALEFDRLSNGLEGGPGRDYRGGSGTRTSAEPTRQPERPNRVSATEAPPLSSIPHNGMRRGGEEVSPLPLAL